MANWLASGGDDVSRSSLNVRVRVVPSLVLVIVEMVGDAPSAVDWLVTAKLVKDLTVAMFVFGCT